MLAISFMQRVIHPENLKILNMLRPPKYTHRVQGMELQYREMFNNQAQSPLLEKFSLAKSLQEAF